MVIRMRGLPKGDCMYVVLSLPRDYPSMEDFEWAFCFYCLICSSLAFKALFGSPTSSHLASSPQPLRTSYTNPQNPRRHSFPSYSGDGSGVRCEI